MAESNRRGEDAAAEHVEDVFDDAVDDDAQVDEKISGGSRTTTKARSKAEGKAVKAAKPKSERVGLFGRIGRFIREVWAELRKVIWPTRKELLTYTAVVVVFVTIMLSIVAGFDYLYAKGVLFVFGNPE